MKKRSFWVNPLIFPTSPWSFRYICKASKAILAPPRSAIFSPLVKIPLTKIPLTGSYWSYCLARACVAFSKFALSAGLHQFCRFPSASNSAPLSSNPWVISCPMIPPIAPKFTAGSASKLNIGACRMAAGKTISL